MEHKKTQDSSQGDSCQARPSCAFAKPVRSRVMYILPKELLELLNFQVCRIKCLKFLQTEIKAYFLFENRTPPSIAIDV